MNLTAVGREKYFIAMKTVMQRFLEEEEEKKIGNSSMLHRQCVLLSLVCAVARRNSCNVQLKRFECNFQAICLSKKNPFLPHNHQSVVACVTLNLCISRQF